jgi:hypothetical protein
VQFSAIVGNAQQTPSFSVRFGYACYHLKLTHEMRSPNQYLTIAFTLGLFVKSFANFFILADRSEAAIMAKVFPDDHNRLLWKYDHHTTPRPSIFGVGDHSHQSLDESVIKQD